MGHLGWTDRGKVLCGGVFNIGDIQGNTVGRRFAIF